MFADTQCEPAHVYESVERLRAFARDRAGLEVVTVTAGNLLQQAVERMNGTRSRYSSIPTWVRGQDGKEAPSRRQCTKDFKIMPIERLARARLGYAKGQVVKKTAVAQIGISMDEIVRMKTSRTRWITNSYPLIDLRLTRDDCIGIVTDAGLPRPRKSACVFCPYTDNARWAEMQREDPESFEQACRADEALRDQKAAGLDSPAFVHRSLRPLREIDFQAIDKKRNALPLFDGMNQECEGMCGL